MKNFGRRLLALCLALTMAVGLGVVASAATTAPYGVSVKDNTISFTKSGKTVGTFKSRDGKLNLTTDKDKDFVLCYYDTAGTYRAVNLAKQTSLVIGGKFSSLTVLAGLDDKISITAGANADIGTFKIASPNPIRVDGKVGTLSATAAANITIGSSAKVTTRSITKTAKVTTEKGAQTGTTGTASKPASSSSKPTTSSSDLRLTVDPIDAEDGDRLRDLLSELEDNVFVYDRKTDDEVSGTCEWTSAGNRTVSKDGSFGFTFFPDDDSYSPIKGSVKIYVDGAHGDVELIFGESIAKLSKGDTMRDLLDWLEKNVYAEDDNGDDVKGDFRISSYKKGDELRERKYSFTFNPDKSKYNDVDDSIEVSLN